MKRLLNLFVLVAVAIFSNTTFSACRDGDKVETKDLIGT